MFIGIDSKTSSPNFATISPLVNPSSSAQRNFFIWITYPKRAPSSLSTEMKHAFFFIILATIMIPSDLISCVDSLKLWLSAFFCKSLTIALSRLVTGLFTQKNLLPLRRQEVMSNNVCYFSSVVEVFSSVVAFVSALSKGTVTLAPLVEADAPMSPS